MKTVEYMVRVKLPNPSGYASCPSGDTEYDDVFKKAIADAVPPGFEVAWPKLNEKWPVDIHGRTCVLLYLRNQDEAFNHYMKEAKFLQGKINEIRKIVR